MIERTEVNGKPATVAYLTLGTKGEFVVVEPKDATLVKVVFDDGGVIFGARSTKQKFYSPDQLRDERGRWTEGGGAAEHGRAWEGKQILLRDKPNKNQTGEIGQKIVLDYLHENGLIDARPMNDEHNNYAIDMVQDHGAIEIKCGLVSNSESAQQWRATIGEPSDKVKEWLKTASGAEVKAFHAAEAQAILDRKEAARARLEKELGKPVKAWTYAVILNPDKGTADLFKFEGYHLRIGWNSKQAKAGYVTTVKYGHH